MHAIPVHHALANHLYSSVAMNMCESDFITATP